jgi:hypothetical protein
MELKQFDYATWVEDRREKRGEGSDKLPAGLGGPT